MSQRERDRLKVMALVLEGRRTQAEAARLLGVSERTVRRIQRRLEAEGDAGIVHRGRGRPSNARLDVDLREKALRLCREEYAGFGPTLAAEKLAERGLLVSVETLRQWMIGAKLWKRRRRRRRHRRRRERKACFGEMVQADGSIHDWLEGRGPVMTLLVMIDDATSKVMARFAPAETTEGYFDLLGRYLRKKGRMRAIYADRHSIFYGEDRDGNPVLTQFGRACRDLDIELIPAGSPQAKGRVERFNGTAQDRLVKELRLAGASTIDEANNVLERVFLPWFNRRCTVGPASPNNAHRPLHRGADLDSLLCPHEERTVANDYTVRWRNQIFQLLPPPLPGLRRGRVTLEARADGSVAIRFRGRDVMFEEITELALPGAPPPHPRVGIASSGVHPDVGGPRRSPAPPRTSGATQQPAATPNKRPAKDHPWRRPYKTKQTRKAAS